MTMELWFLKDAIQRRNQWVVIFYSEKGRQACQKQLPTIHCQNMGDKWGYKNPKWY